MKKLLISFIAILMVFLGTSCGENSSGKTEDNSNTNKNDSDAAEKTDADEEAKDDSDAETPEEPQGLTDEEKLESIKNLAEEYVQFAHGTGVVVGYGIDELTSFAYGVSNVGTGEPLKTDNLFEIGSITKSFTAVTILKLVEEEKEKLKLEDTIDKWFPDFEKGDKITVKMLLNHTSGIKEITEKLNPDQIIEYFKKLDKKFNFEPGEAWADTNSDYMIAGLIIEKVTGKQAHEVIREKILDPIELKNTFMKGYEEYPKANEVKGHNYKPDGSIENYTFDRKTWTAGAMVSNAEDLFKYADALFSGKIIKQETLEIMLTATKVANDTELPYGLGVQISSGTHGLFYTFAGNASAAKNIAQSHSLLAYYPFARIKQIIFNNFPDNKDLLVLNDEIEWVLNNNLKIEAVKDFPKWDELIDHKETTQIFSLYSLYAPTVDYGIGYFTYPKDTWKNYYCKQYLRVTFKQDTDNKEINKVVIAQDCQEPKEYIDLKDHYTMQRTEVYVDNEDFKKAIESKKPISKFQVMKYDYFIENGFIYKGCLAFEDDGNEANKSITMLQDFETLQSTFPGVPIYRIWGKATMKEGSNECMCFEPGKDEQGNTISKPIECPAE